MTILPLYKVGIISKDLNSSVFTELANPPYNAKRNIHYYLNEYQHHFDLIVVFGDLPNDFGIIKTKLSLFISGEPPSIKSYNNRFLNQFDSIISVDTMIKHKDHIFTHPGLPWHVEKSYADLIKINDINKTRDILLISSDKLYSKGHLRRLKLCCKLMKTFGDKIDFYGRGINSFSDKYRLLSKYRYCIAIENDTILHYFTEKIKDCFLARAIPIYVGATNIQSYYSKDAMYVSSYSEYQDIVTIIAKILEDSITSYQAMASHLENAVTSTLNHYTMFNQIEFYINGKVNQIALSPYRDIRLKKHKPAYYSEIMKAIKRKYFNLAGYKYIKCLSQFVPNEA